MNDATLPPAAILAGGLGTRIRVVAGDTPKVLLPVGGRPFLAHLLEMLAAQGVADVVLCLGHAAERVWDAAQSFAPRGLQLRASREETPLGTGGALRRALPELGPAFLVLNGDTYLDAPLAALWSLHRREEAALTLSLVRSEDAVERGSVRVAPDGRVLDFAEKVADGSGLVNAGVYAVAARLLEPVPPNRPTSFEREVIPEALSRGDRVMARIAGGVFVDIGVPEAYLAVRDGLPRPGESR
jgi:NDP-sugar pyrophosphorylase family protein